VIFIVLANSNSYGQKTYYGYQQRENSFDKTKEKLRGIVLTLNQDDRSIQVNLLGELVSYKAGLGDDIAKDYTNKLVKIGPLDLYYDYEKRVTKFGKNELKYSYGKMTQIGKYEVLYDYTGEFSGTKEILETSRPWW
jgi:hypothetical protein